MRNIIPLIAFLLTMAGLRAADRINFFHIGLEQGLSQSTVIDILQDRRENMWIATHNGLNRYDGYDFTVYHHNEADTSSIASDVIRSLALDESGKIWIGTEAGLSLYNPELDIFHNYSCVCEGKEQQVLDVVCLDKGNLLVATDAGILLFDSRRGRFDRTQIPADLQKIRPRTLARYGDEVYIGSYQGLFACSLEDGSVRALFTGDYSLPLILAILKETDTRLWVGTEGDGLYCLNPVTGERRKYKDGKGGLSSNYIRSLALDMSGNLWVGTLTSLNVYEEKTDRFVVYDSNPMKEGSLSQTSVRSLYKDTQGGMWVGTYFGGLNYYHPLRQRFRNIRNVPYHNSLSDNVVSCIVGDAGGNLWIGTNNGGLNRYDFKREWFTSYTVADGLLSNDIKVVYVDEKAKKVYIGAHASGGLNVLDLKSGRIFSFLPHDSLQTGRGIYGILPEANGELLLGAVTGSVMVFETGTGKFRRLSFSDGRLLEERIISMFRDSRGRIWTGTQEGVRVYGRKGDVLSVCLTLPMDKGLEYTSVNVIHEGTDGTFWIGTRNGVYRFNEQKKELHHLSVNQGLPDNVVHGILEDAEGHLWFSTERGLSCYSPSSGEFRNFTDIDGIQSNQFTSYAYCKGKDGQMYFGGVNGITVFNPAVFPENPYIPSVVITELSVLNRQVRPGDVTGILSRYISETKQIELPAGQSTFSLQFSVADYISGMHNKFAYRLEGYEEEWIYTDHMNRGVSYSNLPPGDYCFMVKAANRDGLWNEVPTQLRIVVLPAWYATWWARLCFVLLFLGVVALIFRYLWIRKSMRVQLEMERLDKERMKEVNEMKLRFFINISHELRTPLTLIVAPLQEVIGKITDRKILSKLKYVSASANRLLHLVNQLMDYRRAELGVFRLKVKRIPLHAVLRNIYQVYAGLAESKQIDYRLESELEGKEVWCDEKYIELILNNLLSNAFKYTSSGDRIVLRASEESGKLLMEVQDTGEGIPVEKQRLIFERFYQVDQEHVGSGIGLSLVKRLVELHHGTVGLESKPGEGCIFSVALPAWETAYSPEEIENAAQESEETYRYSTNTAEMYLMDAGGDRIEAKEPVEPEEVEDGKKSCVLLVEDNADIQKYLSQGLSAYFRVLRASNGKEALEILEENEEVNLILSDVMMPVMDGIKLCRQVKRNLKFCHIPLIMLSARSDVKDQLEGLQTGADDYIPKPFLLEMVIAKIRNLLRTYRQAVEHYSKSMEIEPEKVALNPLDEEFLRKAMETVKRHLDDISFSADAFAGEMNMSRSTLHLKMKAVTGESTMDFIRKIRFGEACRLLKEGRYNVTEISEMVGFNTPSYFATSFKKYVGCLPSEYVKIGE